MDSRERDFVGYLGQYFYCLTSVPVAQKSINPNNGSGARLYLSRFAFHSLPGRTGEVEAELKKLSAMVAKAGGKNPRILHAHFASPGAADVIFEQEAPDLQTLETQIKKLTDSGDFQIWTKKMSGLLTESPKREIYLVSGSS